MATQHLTWHKARKLESEAWFAVAMAKTQRRPAAEVVALTKAAQEASRTVRNYPTKGGK